MRALSTDMASPVSDRADIRRSARTRTSRAGTSLPQLGTGRGRAPVSRQHRSAQNRGMDGPVPKAETLVTEDGVPIEAVHLPGDKRLGSSSRTASRWPGGGRTYGGS